MFLMLIIEGVDFLSPMSNDITGMLMLTPRMYSLPVLPISRRTNITPPLCREVNSTNVRGGFPLNAPR